MAEPGQVPEDSLESALSGQAIELWSDAAGRLFIVADETDARRLMERDGANRGEVYTAPELRRVVSIGDPAIVAEVHAWKHHLDGVVDDRTLSPGRSWAQWKADELNRIFQEQGVTGQPGRITAATVRNGERNR